MKIIYNPYLPTWEYIPDGEPHVFDGRLYVFGSHDRFDGNQFCINDYVCWSCPIDDLSDWRKSDYIYHKTQDPNADINSIMQAPDVVKGKDGRYYLYYALGLKPYVSVAVCDKPDGKYEYLGTVKYNDGIALGLKEHDIFAFDPGVFMDDDGKCYLYVGFGPEENGVFKEACKKYRLDGAYVMELDDDMLTIKSSPKKILDKAEECSDRDFIGHEFFEASSMRKINNKYYFIYSSILSHELCYAISNYPDKEFKYGGTIISIGDIGYKNNKEPMNYLGNTHGSIININSQYYVFYHRQTNRHSYSRQGCAEKIKILDDGSIPQVEITSQGLYGKALPGIGYYSSSIVCNLWSKEGALTYGLSNTPEAINHPYLTQKGEDRECDENQYIANMMSGSTAGFKFFDLSNTNTIKLFVENINTGIFEIRTSINKKPICVIPSNKINIKHKISIKEKYSALYFTYIGEGKCDLIGFELR